MSSSSEPSSGSTCCSSPEWSSTPEQCPPSYGAEGECSVKFILTECLKKISVEQTALMAFLLFADLLSAAESPEQGNMQALTSIVDSISASDGAVAFPVDIPK